MYFYESMSIGDYIFASIQSSLEGDTKFLYLSEGTTFFINQTNTLCKSLLSILHI